MNGRHIVANPEHAEPERSSMSTEQTATAGKTDVARFITLELERKGFLRDSGSVATFLDAVTREVSAALTAAKEPTSEIERESWGIVFHDERQVWQIIAPNAQLIIDGIGEFRFPDNRSKREHDRCLAEQIRDNHNAALARAQAPLVKALREVRRDNDTLWTDVTTEWRAELHYKIRQTCDAALSASPSIEEPESVREMFDRQPHYLPDTLPPAGGAVLGAADSERLEALMALGAIKSEGTNQDGEKVTFIYSHRDAVDMFIDAARNGSANPSGGKPTNLERETLSPQAAGNGSSQSDAQR